MSTLQHTSQQAPAIVVLGNGSVATARRIQAIYVGARIFGLSGRVDSADACYDNFGTALREFYQSNTPIIALCAAGIVIRTLAPLLASKGVEPAVLAVAEDGSAVVPLLGGVSGVNVMAREIGEALGVAAAITTSGELRFGTCLLNPPEGYVLSDLDHGKRFVADLLSGKTLKIDGEADWLANTDLPVTDSATHTLRITTSNNAAAANELLIYPRSVVAVIDGSFDFSENDLADAITTSLNEAGIAPQSLACLLADGSDIQNARLQTAAKKLNLPSRFSPRLPCAVEAGQRFVVPGLHGGGVIPTTTTKYPGLSFLVSNTPLDISKIGHKRGSLTVIGLGPGASDLMVPAAKTALQNADDILGYETYVTMAGPFREDQKVHITDNREEMQRARHAFELAAAGRDVVMVSSGDPGVFAMAAAVVEALHESTDPLWHTVELTILPGVSAAMATAARAGAPLGHDFCLISLSDNLKPWEIIENRLDHAAAADFVLAFYNPISKARPWQLAKALEIVAAHRAPDTVVVLGRDIGRPAETLRTTTLSQLTPDQVDMRTMVIIGSSTTRQFARNDGSNWVYTPRWYPVKPIKETMKPIQETVKPKNETVKPQ
jgi:cobalt-precorrin 5A hydrolase/precorrin-3B C17-methyltransferase